MRKLLPFILLCFASTSSRANFGIYATAAYVSVNNSTNFYNCMAPGNGQSIGSLGFAGTNFGSFYQNDGMLVLAGAEIKTYKGGSDNVCSGTMYYTVYLQGSRPQSPTFLSMGLGFYADCTDPACGSFPNAFTQEKGGGCCNPGDQKWQFPGGGSGGGNSGNINLTLLPAGNFTLELYYQCSGENNGSGCSSIQYDGNNNNPSNYTASFSIIPALPVHFGDIAASAVQHDIHVSWSTLSEENTARFVVERSANGAAFSSIATVAAAGFSNQKRQYHFVDQQPLPSENYYRIQMLEKSGKTSYSAIAKATVLPASSYRLLSNQVSNQLTMYLPQGSTVITVYELSGKTLKRFVANGTMAQIAVDNWPSGKYYVSFESNTTKLVLPFVKL